VPGLTVAGTADGATSAPSTTSTAYADITDMAVTFSTTTVGHVIAWMSIGFSLNANNIAANFGLSLDAATEVGAIQSGVGSNNGKSSTMVFGVWNNVAVGSHTIKGRWQLTAAGTLTGTTTMRHLLVATAT
jgi:hypothetical protein